MLDKPKTEATSRICGLRVIDDVRQRCVIDEDTGCWHWKGATVHDSYGKPQQRLWIFDKLRQKHRVMSGPLAVLELSGRRVTGKEIGWRECQCLDCMNPDHMLSGSRPDWGVWLKKNGHWVGVTARIAANRKSGRARGKATMEVANAIRTSDKTGRALAAEFGLSEQRVSQIKHGKVWAQTTPWAGLGAR